MTAQIAERLIYKNEELNMCVTPLGSYFSLTGKRPDFESNCTALWRGYVGTWEITGDRLYLVSLSATLTDGTEANLATIFPGFPDRVFAHWYSGEIRIPQGKILNYVHMGFASTYERDLILTIDSGILVSEQIILNGESANDNASEGYDIGAMSVFPSEHNKGDS